MIQSSITQGLFMSYYLFSTYMSKKLDLLYSHSHSASIWVQRAPTTHKKRGRHSASVPITFQPLPFMLPHGSQAWMKCLVYTDRPGAQFRQLMSCEISSLRAFVFICVLRRRQWEIQLNLNPRWVLIVSRLCSPKNHHSHFERLLHKV